MLIHYPYIAGPFSGTEYQITMNVNNAVRAFHELLDLGFCPYIPHLFRHAEVGYIDSRKRPYEEWMKLDMEWLAKCDAIVRLPGVSPGADKEVDFAFHNKIPIFFSVNQLRIYINNNMH